MKLCIPVDVTENNETTVFGHFGSAPYFLVFDTEKGSSKIIENTNQHHAHGTCNPMGQLVGEKLDAVLTGGMGGRAVQKLNEGGVKVFRSQTLEIKDLVKQYLAGELEEITPANACGHNHGHK